MATLSTGADAEGGERFGNCEYNNIKNHWRTANPCASLSDLQPGMIVSDENDDRLYVVSLISGCGCSEILQDCVPLSDDKHIGFGYNREGDIGYSSIHCALLMGIPVAALDSGACERGLIIMDEAYSLSIPTLTLILALGFRSMTVRASGRGRTTQSHLLCNMRRPPM